MDCNITNTSAENNYNYARLVYSYTVPPLSVFCLISVVVNIKVLLSVQWLRRPISPTILISLSLAAADAISSLLLGMNILVNSYLSTFNVTVNMYIQIYLLEMCRLTSIIITVVHLLALSVNHWLGVLKPLHYSSIMTTRRVMIVILCLWIFPTIFFVTYFAAQKENVDDFSEAGIMTHVRHSQALMNCTHLLNENVYDHNENHTHPLNDTADVPLLFLNRFNFRITFSFLFFIPLVLMVFYYTHILIIVIKHQIAWKKLSRSGSKKSKSLTKATNQQRRSMEGSIKAICTTLLILGSCLLGWIPAVLKFILVCDEGCKYTPQYTEKHVHISVNLFISHLAYFLLILKTLANPIIYSRRMIEIKEATRRMNSEICSKFCASNRRENNQSDTQSIPLGCTSSMRSTAIYKLNGYNSSQRNVRRTPNQTRTLV